MLARFDERAAGYDRENRFFDEDFAELRRSGYLDIAIPEKFGGPGLLLAEVLELQRRLAYVAPATALGVNMHLYFTGTAADLHRAGDSSCDCRCRVDETWDVLGMRATQSQDTFLDRVFVPDEYVPLVCPAGLKGAGLFHLGIFAWGLLGFPTVYAAIARRAYDLAIEGLPKRTSVALTRSMAHHPEAQHLVADMRMALEAVDPFLEQVARDWSDGVDHGHDWPVKIISAKHFAVTQAFRVVDLALDLSGGAGISPATGSSVSSGTAGSAASTRPTTC